MKTTYRIKARTAASIDAGTDLSKRGKEWYALWVAADADAALSFVEHKIEELYPELRQSHWLSTAGVILDLYKNYPNMIQITADQKDVIYIHKKTFKRHLKKAITRNFLKNR